MSEPEKSYCQRCDFETNHSILFKKTVGSDSEEYNYSQDYMIVKCLGCDTISYRNVFFDLESSYPDENGDWIPDVTIETYPKKIRVAKRIANSHALPEKIRLIYNEAIDSYNADCFILTGVAFRAVIEAICIEENILGNNLEKKINNLVRQKLITEKEANRLHSIRFIGNDSVHEMKSPSEMSLKIVLSIIEHLLNNIYLIDYDAEGVLETVIDKFSEFERLLNRCINELNAGDEVPLAGILNKEIRRLNGRINEFETDLINKITSNVYTKLSIGKIAPYGNDTHQRQHFVIK